MFWGCAGVCVKVVCATAYISSTTSHLQSLSRARERLLLAIFGMHAHVDTGRARNLR